jgi:hypothetical protein
MLIDPVSTENGDTFERRPIQKWLRTSTKSPLTGVYFNSTAITKNLLISKTLRSYLEILKFSVLKQ